MAMIPPWEPEQHRYALSERVYLLKADKIEWGIYSSVYYNAEYNGFFKDQGYEYEGWRDPFWIYEGEALIGGVVIAPNVMFTLFFIPPFRDVRRIVLLLKEALISWSDLSKDIIIFEVLPDQVELLGRAGFWPSAFRCRWMQRPTEAFVTTWEDCFVVETPEMIQQDGINQLRNENDIAKLLYRSFAGAGSIDAIRRQQTDMQFYQEDIREYVSYTNDLVRNASTIVVDSHTNEVLIN
ncbi:GNAT family N-acetyltransferase [Paenibacillus popilliae]|uniref:GNAT family N-acetyltransferase n=1 Tax=Paenibacillus popilliae TaxID=78057 RepID=A0ABY3ANT8_PAEPP|nr:GNAT family N-acetyltransferase [Paenibacillus sp. SDF0028]TQR44403.1 GNAT family N-acetyltransferase [Paenibacillus sp. SDF0028]